MSLTLLALVLSLSVTQAERIVVAEPSGPDRHLRYRFEATNTTAGLVSGAHLITYVPVLATGNQRLLWVQASHDARLDTDELGNAWLSVALPPLPPHGTVVVSITAAVAVGADFESPAAAADSATAAEPYVEADDPAIVALAASLPRRTPWQTARAAYDLVRAEVRPSDFEPQDLGAAHALATGAGDCTEMAYAFIALARAAGLQARLAGGWVAPVSAVLSPARYHNWAEVHDGAAWRAVDPHAGRFGDAADYVATHLGGIDRSGPLRGFHRFRADHPALALRMLGAP